MTARWTFRVLDLTTTFAGAYCGHLLSSAGHRRRAGRAARRPPAAARGARAGRRSPTARSGPLFSWLAGGQESVTVDPGEPEPTSRPCWRGRRRWTPSSGHGARSSRSSSCEAAAPDTTVTAITPFGLTGPWADRAATEFTLQALSGAPGLRGSRAWPPMSAGGQHGEYMAGVFARRGDADRAAAGGRHRRGRGHRPVRPRGRDDDAAVQPAHDGDPGRRRAGRSGPRRRWPTSWSPRTATSGSPSSTGSSTGGTSAP